MLPASHFGTLSVPAFAAKPASPMPAATAERAATFPRANATEHVRAAADWAERSRTCPSLLRPDCPYNNIQPTAILTASAAMLAPSASAADLPLARA